MFRADVKGDFSDESIVGDSGDGGVFNATVVDYVFFIVGGVFWIGVDIAVNIFSCFLT